MEEVESFDVKLCKHSSSWANNFKPKPEEYDPFKEVKEH